MVSSDFDNSIFLSWDFLLYNVIFFLCEGFNMNQFIFY